MRHLAVRFVRQINLARIASNECPTFGLNNHIHVVDPQLDLLDRFQGENAIELCRSILARKLSLDLLKIRNDYDIWCNAFKALLEAEDKPALEKRHIRGKLLDTAAGLLSTLELPNDLDRDRPCTSRESEGVAAVCNLTRPHIDDFVVQVSRSGCHRDFVRLRLLIRSSLQRLLLLVHPNPQNVSFPYLVRPAVVEACNLQLDSFPLVVEDNSYLSLTGVDLPSLISPLIKCQFSHKYNIWPLVLITSGNVHPTVSSHLTNNSEPFGQNAQLSILVMDGDLYKCSEIVQQLTAFLHAFFAGIGLSFDIADVKPPNLFLYERSAHSFSHGSPAVELARFSSIGDYVSRRARITKAVPTGADFLKMAFVRVNLDAIVKSYGHL